MANPVLSDPVYYAKRLQRLGIVENPFAAYQDGHYFYPLTDQRLRMIEILALVAEKPLENIIQLISDPQLGKTSLARRLTQIVKADPNYYADSVLFTDEHVTPANMVKAISAELGLVTQSKKHEDRLKELNEYLERQMQAQRKSLFVVIDADINPDALDTLLNMANWHSEIRRSQRSKPVTFSLVQIALFGRKNASFYVKRRLPLFDVLNRLTRNILSLGLPPIHELSELLERQVRAAGRETPLFTEDALNLLVDESGQVPGRLIDLANQCFLALAESNENVINPRLVSRVLSKTAFELGPSTVEEGYEEVQHPAAPGLVEESMREILEDRTDKK